MSVKKKTKKKKDERESKWAYSIIIIIIIVVECSAQSELSRQVTQLTIVYDVQATCTCSHTDLVALFDY